MTNSLGIKKSPKDTKIVVAMSGGVDSSVVAGLMKEEGYNVTGITLKLYDDANKSFSGRQCCAGQDIVDAKRVSETLDIDHKILYYQKKFKAEVIDSFIDSYVAGETPIPCVQCNQTVKFRDLFKFAKELRADALVTGHYVLRHEYNGKGVMYRANDRNRDQSYFLFSTTQKQLDYLRFPLGSVNKSETRNIANKLKGEIIEHKNFIGGRYSVMSEAGMIPAYLMDLKIEKFKQLNKLMFNKNFANSLISNVYFIYKLLLKKKK